MCWLDSVYQIPNGLGALSGVAQLCLYAFYKNATPRELEDQQTDADEKGTPMKPVSHSVYVQMEKNGELQGAKQSMGSLPKHATNGTTWRL